MPDKFDEKDYESFGQFLRFLLFEHGAYPDGSPEKAGEQWVQAEFARRVGSSERLVRYWLKDEKSPRDLRPIERALFGTNKKYEQWRMLLRKLNQSPRNGLVEANASTGNEGGATSEPPPAQILHPEIRAVAGFTGRADQLAAIDAALWQGGGSAALTNATAIHGLGGVGKTVLAREYGWRNRARYRGVWWLRAETQDDADQTLIDDLLALGGELQIPRFDEIRERDQSRAIQLTLAAIEQSGAGTPWLMIYDNAEKPNAIEKLTPRSGAHLLITSRWPHWRGRAAPLAVDVFPPDIAIGYLLDGAPFPEREAAARLAEALGYLPLALSHARAYCGHCPEAEKLVSAIAFFAPDQIPASLFTDDFIAEDALNKALAALSNISLITHETLEDGTRGFGVHRLVQAVMRARLGSDEQEARQSALSLMHNALAPLSVREHGDWPQVVPLVPHVLAALDGALNNGEGVETTASLCVRLDIYLSARGDYQSAIIYSKRALAIREAALGPDHPDTALSLNNLGGLHRERGEHDAAEPLFARALAIREAALGPDHPETATSLNNLAGLHYAQGEHDAAEPLVARALAIREAALGPDHPDTATSLNNLGGLHHDRGEHDAAEPLFARALAIREAALGPDHPDTATSFNNLAMLHRARGQHDAAEPLYARALAICEAALGPDHPRTQTTKRNYERLKADIAGQDGSE